MKMKVESAEQEFKELVAKRQEEIIKETVKKVVFMRKAYVLVELLFTGLGFFIVGYFVSLWLALGIFLIVCGIRMSITRTVYRQRSNLWREIWKH